MSPACRDAAIRPFYIVIVVFLIIVLRARGTAPNASGNSFHKSNARGFYTTPCKLDDARTRPALRPTRVRDRTSYESAPSGAASHAANFWVYMSGLRGSRAFMGDAPGGHAFCRLQAEFASGKCICMPLVFRFLFGCRTLPPARRCRNAAMPGGTFVGCVEQRLRRQAWPTNARLSLIQGKVRDDTWK